MIGKKLFYHCKRLPTQNPDIPNYSQPIKKYENYMPLSGYVDTLRYGESIDMRWRMVVDLNSNKGEYNVGDLLYLDGATPDTGTAYNLNAVQYNGRGANARIEAVKFGLKAIVIEIVSIIPQR